MRNKMKKKEETESVRISAKIVNRARVASINEGSTIKHVIDRELDKTLPQLPKK